MSSKAKFIPFSLAMLFAFLATPVIGQSGKPSQKVSRAESWVLSRIAEGALANLADRFPNEEDRVLSSAFLQDLFSKDPKDLHVGRKGVQIGHAVVKDEVDLGFTDVPYDVALFAFRFERKVNFSFSDFRKNVSLWKTTFAGPVLFQSTNINGTLRASETHFTDQNSGVSFLSMKVGDLAVFDGATFDGPAVFDGATLHTLDIREAMFNSKSDPPSFFDTKCGTFEFALLTPEPNAKPRFASSPEFEGMTFDRIYSDYTDFGSLSVLCSYSKFSPGFYSEVEAYLRKNGDNDRADELFIEQKQRERKERVRGFPRLTNLFLDIVVGYGRKPQRALYLGLLIVGLGCVVFWSEQGMVPQDIRENSATTYNPFWYSLDLFAPVIDLQSAKNWMPKQHRAFARNYVHLHRILGWVLVPIGIAAWTGILK